MASFVRVQGGVGVFACMLLVAQTATAQDVPLERIAFGSCAHQDRPQPIWGPIVANKPQLFLFIGDNIYGDTKDMTILKKKYELLGAMPGYQTLLKACPVLATWDDHDYGLNDAGADYAQRVQSQQIFLDFFDVPKDSPRRKQEGIYDAKIFGPADKSVQVILLDTRYHRDPLKRNTKVSPQFGNYVGNTDPKATILGAEQWRWLEEQLRKPAKVRLFVSSIQVVPEDHGYEKWMNFPLERERLLKLLKDTKAGGVIFLSGDRHLAELSVMDGGVGYPLYDLTSSGLNQGFKKWRKHEVNRHRVASMNYGDNFGLITIDWSAVDPLIRMQIRDADGEVTIQHKAPLSLLQPGALKAKSLARAKLATGEPLTAEVVAQHLNKKCTVELEVQATGSSATLVFLNSAPDRTAEENFTVVLDKEAQDKLKKAGITSMRAEYEGKQIRVTGTLTLFRERPQIIVSDPAQIEVMKK
jgi:alkaline phosphatase D